MGNNQIKEAIIVTDQNDVKVVEAVLADQPTQPNVMQILEENRLKEEKKKEKQRQLEKLKQEKADREKQPIEKIKIDFSTWFAKKHYMEIVNKLMSLINIAYVQELKKTSFLLTTD